jgi:plasmid stabilization system protein ParE
MKARFTNRSVLHLTRIRDYLARDNPQLAELVRLRILATVERLETFPSLGHRGRRPDTHELRVAGLPYVIVYQRKNPVTVLAIFHTAQAR